MAGFNDRRPNRDEQREERRREAARHTGLMKAAFGRETDEAIENARIYEEGEGRSLLWGAEAAAAAEAAKRAAEMAEADYAISTLGGRADGVIPVDIPGRDWRHSLARVAKIAPTPEKYPRRAGIPEKRPL